MHENIETEVDSILIFKKHKLKEQGSKTVFIQKGTEIET